MHEPSDASQRCIEPISSTSLCDEDRKLDRGHCRGSIPAALLPPATFTSFTTYLRVEATAGARRHRSASVSLMRSIRQQLEAVPQRWHWHSDAFRKQCLRNHYTSQISIENSRVIRPVRSRRCRPCIKAKTALRAATHPGQIQQFD